MINKFGKTEANGGGFRALIADALAREIPIIIAVPENNLPQWQTFAAGLTINHDLEALPGDPQQMALSLGLSTEPSSAQPIDEKVAATAT